MQKIALTDVRGLRTSRILSYSILPTPKLLFETILLVMFNYVPVPKFHA